MQIILFEDHITAENRPITLPRPAFAVSMAGTCLYNIARRVASNLSIIVRPYLRAIAEATFEFDPPAQVDTLFLNASLAPSLPLLDELIEEAKKGENFLIQVDSRVGAAYLRNPPDDLYHFDEKNITSFLLAQQYRTLRKNLPLVQFPFDVIRYHQEFFHANIQLLTDGLTESRPGLFVGEGVNIHDTAVIDSDAGPVILHDAVSVGPFALLVGPIIVGANSKIIDRASIKEEVQIGHTCKIGGEVECSIVEPYTNKQHHGFLGHSYVGSWVNMGAGTCNSDLKNTYGEVTIQHRGHKIETGMQFLGCVIGDYSKMAINTSIFTGKIVGVSSYLYGFVGTNVPSFTNYARTFGQETEYLLSAAVRTQQRMFARRDVEQTPADIKLLEDMYELTQDERLMSTEALSF